MWWTKKEPKSSGQKQRSMSWSTHTYNGSSTLASSSLDQSKHRCSSVRSLLSMEQSLVTCDDESNIRLVPLACQQMNVDIPSEVQVENGKVEEVEPALDDKEIIVRNLSKDLPIALPVALIDDAFSPLQRPAEAIEDSIIHQIEKMKVTNDIPSYPSPAVTKTDDIEQTNEITQRAVRFGTVEVHHHKQEIGSTVPLRGPPVGLSWMRLSHETFESVDDYLWETHPTGEPRPYRMLKLPTRQRADR